MKILTLFTSLYLILLLTTVNVYAQLSIDTCHVKARHNFPMIKQYDLIEKTEAYNISNANKAYLPQLDATVIGGMIEGLPNIGVPEAVDESGVDLKMIALLQVNQVIWDGGVTKANKKRIEANSDIAKANVEVTMYALKDRVNELFFGLLLIDEQQQHLEILISTLERRLERVEVAVSNGTAFQSDLDEIMVELIKVKQQRDGLKFNRTAYIQVLGAMVGEVITDDVVLTRPEHLNWADSDSIQRPELKLYHNQRLLCNAALDLHRASLFPKFGLMGYGVFIQPGLDFGTASLDHVFVAGLSLNWNLGGLYRHKNSTQILELDRQQIAVQEETFLYSTNLELRQLNVEINRVKSEIEQDREMLQLRQRLKQAYDVKYENGICTMADLLDRVNDERIAQQNLTTHEVQYLHKLYQHQILTGNVEN